jgi:hypothetical protein
MPRLQGLWLSGLQGLRLSRLWLPRLLVTHRCTFDG